METIKYYLIILSVSIKHFFERFSYRKGYKDGYKEAEQFYTTLVKEERELRLQAQEEARLYKFRAELAQKLKNIN